MNRKSRRAMKYGHNQMQPNRPRLQRSARHRGTRRISNVAEKAVQPAAA